MSPSPSPSPRKVTGTTLLSLYEANYAEWRPYMDSILSSHELLETSTDWHSATAADLIAAQVHPSFLHRVVPFAKRCDSTLLLRRLEEATGPFRFLSLPPELRNRIYDLLLPQNTPRGTRHKRSSITQASRQLREESLPIFFAASTFFIRFDTQHRDVQECVADARKWAELIGVQSLQRISCVELELDMWNPAAYLEDPVKLVECIEISFSRTRGLDVRCPERLCQASRDAVELHLNRVDASRKVLGLEGGGAILMALITDVDVWKWKELQLETYRKR
ncbi:hypothetical protein LTR36_010099 [Oleoguttula mirabilis]|uniref:F-box domain-containing protein n=1 Tax=Oleoguttula mirabilis TaxID=1507867 RepID=A0AAV9JS16_9PEZI|nr:hypothetical protein LTR36_010099 [Oleoguttula mirabilis]